MVTATSEMRTWILGAHPKKLQHEKRAEWKRDDPVEYDKQESRRQLLLDTRSCTKSCSIRAVHHGRVSDNTQNIDVLGYAWRSQDASVSLEGISMSSQRLAHRRVGDLPSTQTAPPKMEV